MCLASPESPPVHYIELIIDADRAEAAERRPRHDYLSFLYFGHPARHTRACNCPLISVDYLASMPGVHGGRIAIEALRTVPGTTLFTQALNTDQAQRFLLGEEPVHI